MRCPSHHARSFPCHSPVIYQVLSDRVRACPIPVYACVPSRQGREGKGPMHTGGRTPGWDLLCTGDTLLCTGDTLLQASDTGPRGKWIPPKHFKAVTTPFNARLTPMCPHVPPCTARLTPCPRLSLSTTATVQAASFVPTCYNTSPWPHAASTVPPPTCCLAALGSAPMGCIL